MYKAVIADDEGVIVNGLKKLIDWGSLNIQIVGDAKDGRKLKELILAEEPDLVITDIMMPKMTGLEVISWYREIGTKTKFIFISGYQEFSYAQEAIRNGAVDYLLKPVGRRDLEDAVKKAINILEDQNTAEIFREEKDEIQKLFQDINDGRSYENEELYRLFEAEEISLENCFFAGLCVGIRPDYAHQLSVESFEHFNLTRFSVYNRISEAFRSQKLGFVVKKEDDALHIMGVFPKEHEQDFVEEYIENIQWKVESEVGVPLCIGIGLPAEQVNQLKNAYKTAKFAFNLYFFEEKTVINFQEIHKDYTVSFEDYEESIENAFRAIIAKDSSAMDKINDVMDNIYSIHYGNRYAAQSRTMNFTGDLNSKLYRYHLLDGDFYKIQDELQHKVENMTTFSELRICISEHYEKLLEKVYETGRSKDKVLIEQVKDYIREHYAEDLSIRELSDVACVSQNYFSSLFKKETGQNYKAYLTQIRMEAALKLLQETDYKTYEIGEQVGYNNVRRFVDAFKQIYSVSPMEYKKGLKEK